MWYLGIWWECQLNSALWVPGMLSWEDTGEDPDHTGMVYLRSGYVTGICCWWRTEGPDLLQTANAGESRTILGMFFFLIYILYILSRTKLTLGLLEKGAQVKSSLSCWWHWHSLYRLYSHLFPTWNQQHFKCSFSGFLLGARFVSSLVNLQGSVGLLLCWAVACSSSNFNVTPFQCFPCHKKSWTLWGLLFVPFKGVWRVDGVPTAADSGCYSSIFKYSWFPVSNTSTTRKTNI